MNSGVIVLMRFVRMDRTDGWMDGQMDNAKTQCPWPCKVGGGGIKLDLPCSYCIVFWLYLYQFEQICFKSENFFINT